MKLRPKIDPHDYETKKGHVVRFLKQGDKVKITIMFRGREQHRPELGYRLLQRLAGDVEELGFVESTPKPGRTQHDDGSRAAQEEVRSQGRGQGRARESGPPSGKLRIARRSTRSRSSTAAEAARTEPKKAPRRSENLDPDM